MSRPTILKELALGGYRKLRLLQFDDLLAKATGKYAVGIHSRGKKGVKRPQGAYANLLFFTNKRDAEKDYNARAKELAPKEKEPA